MKISIIMDILVLRFYRYIRDIYTNILTQNIDNIKVNKNSKKILRKILKYYIRSKNRYFKFIYLFKNFDIYNLSYLIIIYP